MGDLVPQANSDRLKAFRESHDPQMVADLIQELGLTLRSEMELLKDAMGKTQDMKIRLKAQAQLRALLKDIRMASTILLTMTKREDGSFEQTAIAPALMDDLIKDNTNAANNANALYEIKPAAPRIADRHLLPDDDGFSQQALERALRRTIQPRSRKDIGFGPIPGDAAGAAEPGDERPDSPAADDGGSEAGPGGRPSVGGTDDGDAPVLRPPGPSGNDPKLAGIWPPPEEEPPGTH